MVALARGPGPPETGYPSWGLKGASQAARVGSYLYSPYMVGFSTRIC